MNPLLHRLRLLLGLPAALLALLLAGSALAEERIVLAGSSTLAPLISELARQYRLSHPEVSIEVRAGGSQVGIAEVRAGRADIGMVSRALHVDEKELFTFTFARDGVALVVHKENPVRELPRARAADVLAGRVANWKAVGGADAPIEVISRPPGYSSLEIVRNYFGLMPGDIKAAAVAADTRESLRLASERRHAISFFSVGLAEHEAERGKPLKLLNLDGIAASSASIRDGRYPLARQLNLVTRNIPTGATRAFIEFVLSSAARKTIEDHDFVPFVN